MKGETKIYKMKLTKTTTPQAKNYQCDKCKAIKSHSNMYNDNYCYDCVDIETGKIKQN